MPESLFSPHPSTTPARPTPSSPPPATPMTDFALIESQKENIRPLASGRSAAALGTLYEKDSAAEKMVQEGHEQFQREIEEVERRDREGEEMPEGVQDVLDVYNRYVLFTVQHHPSSAHHLLPLLESTTRRFIGDARYAQDVRYLKLWTQFCRLIERREEVWAFLESRDIGTRHAAFYEEWASALEGLGRKKKADDVYRLGIARKAAPLERLKMRHQTFLARILVPANGVVPDDEPSSASSSSRSRAVLGQVASSSLPVAGATQLAPSLRQSTKNNGSKMEIFADGATRSGEDAAPGEWAEFGTRDGRRKENVVEATSWKGETMPQKKVAPRTPKMEVFKDSTDNNEAVRPADELFSRSKQPQSDADLLKADPLRNYDTSTLSVAIPSLPAPPSARKPPRQAKSVKTAIEWECPTGGAVTTNANGKTERRMFDWDQVTKGGEEWSLEEVRARQRGLLGKAWRAEVQDWERNWHKPGSSTPKKEPPKKKAPSPTVNTKLAALEVAMMFDQTIHGSKVRDSDSESSDDDDDDEAQAPIETAPTPLPAARPVAMMTPAGMVPPTPTPAGGLGKLNIFADENAVPPSSSKKFNVFGGETPAKTPLATRTPLAASSSKPRAFGVFSEDEQDAAPAAVDATPVPAGRSLATGNIFATPALAGRAPARRVLASAIPEEPEDGEGQEGEEEVRGVTDAVEHVNINDEEDEDEEMESGYNPRRGGRFQIHEMTPITERTCEYTQFTTMRSSTTRRISVMPDSEEVEEQVDEAMVVSQEDDVAVVQGEASRWTEGEVPLHRGSTSPDTTQERSGMVDTEAFGIPDGFTIHQQREESGGQTMVIVDESRQRDVSADDDEFVTAQHAPALPNPCNPIDDETISALLQVIDPPLSALPGFADHRQSASNRLEAMQKRAKSKTRRPSVSAPSSRTSIAPEPAYIVDLAGKEFEIAEKIGEGGFGAVFLGVDVAARQAEDAASDEEDGDEGDDDDDDGADKCLVAIKVEKPGSIWEAVILDRIHSRLDEATRRSIIRPRNLYAFADESFLLLDYSSQGTLLDIVNKASSIGIAPATAGGPSCLDELLAMFFTVELLKILESLHSNAIIHGDLKIDNCLVRLEPFPLSQWSTAYTRTGQNGWAAKGVRLIDFGRAADLSLFPAGEAQKFVADWKVDERDCPEVREGREWSWEADYWGLAGVAYCMLFGKYLQTEMGEEGRWRIATPLKRYWQTQVWTSLFDALLNPKATRPDGSLPITRELGQIRGEMEGWLEENCQKGGKILKAMLKKIELEGMKGRR